MGNWFSLLYLQKCQLSSKSHSVEEWACIVRFITKRKNLKRGPQRCYIPVQKREKTTMWLKIKNLQHPGHSPFQLLNLKFTFFNTVEFPVLLSSTAQHFSKNSLAKPDTWTLAVWVCSPNKASPGLHVVLHRFICELNEGPRCSRSSETDQKWLEKILKDVEKCFQDWIPTPIIKSCLSLFYNEHWLNVAVKKGRGKKKRKIIFQFSPCDGM